MGFSDCIRQTSFYSLCALQSMRAAGCRGFSWEELPRCSECLEDSVPNMMFRDITNARGDFMGWDSGALCAISSVTLQTQSHSPGPDLCPGNQPDQHYCRHHQQEVRTTGCVFPGTLRPSRPSSADGRLELCPGVLPDFVSGDCSPPAPLSREGDSLSHLHLCKESCY